MHPRILGRGVVIVAVLLFAPSTLPSAQNSGITRLIAVSVLKAENANDEAMRGAAEQKDLVKRQKTERDRARESAVLKQLEANARRTTEALQSIKTVNDYLKAHPCK